MRLKCNRTLDEIERIVHATEVFFAENDIDNDTRLAVDLVVEELFVNMVKYNAGTDSRIEIEMLRVPEGIKVIIMDFNVERFDPTAHGVVDIDLPLEERTPGGLGIYLILKMVDSIHYDYQNRTSKITFVKNTEHHQNV